MASKETGPVVQVSGRGGGDGGGVTNELRLEGGLWGFEELESAVLRQIGVNVRETEGVSWFEFPWKPALRQGFKCKFLVCKLMLRSISRGWRSELQKEGSQSERSMSILLRVKVVRNL